MAIVLPALRIQRRAIANEAKYGAALCALAYDQAKLLDENKRLPRLGQNDMMAFVRNPFLRQLYVSNAGSRSLAIPASAGTIWANYAGQDWPEWVASPASLSESSVRHTRLECRGRSVIVLWISDALGVDADTDAKMAAFDSGRFDDFLAGCTGAIDLLEKLPQDFSEVMAQGVTIIPIASSEGAHESFSTWDMPGVIFLGATDDHVHLAEAIIHEVCHHILNGLSRFEPLAISDEPKFASPWRTDPRPAVGVLHGIFVFSNVVLLQDACIRNGRSGDLRLRNRHRNTVRKMRSALNLLPSKVLTSLGREVLELSKNSFHGVKWLE